MLFTLFKVPVIKMVFSNTGGLMEFYSLRAVSTQYQSCSIKHSSTRIMNPKEAASLNTKHCVKSWDVG